MANEKLGVATEPSPESHLWARRALHLCNGAWHSEIWTIITFIVLHI